MDAPAPLPLRADPAQPTQLWNPRGGRRDWTRERVPQIPRSSYVNLPKNLCVVKTNGEISHMGTWLGYMSSSVTPFGEKQNSQDPCSMDTRRGRSGGAWKQTNTEHMFMLWPPNMANNDDSVNRFRKQGDWRQRGAPGGGRRASFYPRALALNSFLSGQ